MSNIVVHGGIVLSAASVGAVLKLAIGANFFIVTGVGLLFTELGATLGSKQNIVLGAAGTIIPTGAFMAFGVRVAGGQYLEIALKTGMYLLSTFAFMQYGQFLVDKTQNFCLD